jgi:hypothetical protein
MGAVRFEFGGGSGFGVEFREHQCVLQWEAKSNGRLRVSVGGGKRSGRAGGRGVDGCCVLTEKKSLKNNS